MSVYLCFVFFFFQAEDGIRDIGVTGVQTCALPICGEAAVLPPRESDFFCPALLDQQAFNPSLGTAGPFFHSWFAQLSRRLEDRLRTQALPILDVERTVHPGNAPVPFHLEYRSRLFRGSAHHSIVLPERMDLLSTTPEGASDAGVAEFGPEDPWLQSLSPVNLGQVPVESAQRKMSSFPGQLKNQAIGETQCRF